MMELKQKNKLTNVSVSSFVGGVRKNTENSVFTWTAYMLHNVASAESLDEQSTNDYARPLGFQ
jgi:hypothetical protein